MSTWVVLDANHICHRAFHTVGGLSYGDMTTGTIFGFMREVAAIRDLLLPDVFVFCFDAGKNKRQELYPKYKQDRRERFRKMDEEQQAAYLGLKRQIRKLRFEVLKDCGFRNVLWQIGHEADDVIASVCQMQEPESIVIVGSDHDLYQLLSPRVSIWDLRTSSSVTMDSFRRQYGLEPPQWADVKAIAGCSTDGVLGVPGVGEKTAAKFLRGDLSGGKKYDAIVAGNHLWHRNLRLVRLPFQGTQQFEIRQDRVTKQKWEKVCKRYNFKSLLRSWG